MNIVGLTDRQLQYIKRCASTLPVPPPNQAKGRRKGAIDKVTRIIKEAILLAGEKQGNKLARKAKEPPEGLVSYLKWLAAEHPQSYAALLGKVLPMQVEHSRGSTIEYKTVEELQSALRERGLPVDRIYPLLRFEPKKRA
jgi:hypothetical protein